MKTNLYLQQPHPPPHTRRQSQYPCAENWRLHLVTHKIYHATPLVRNEEISIHFQELSLKLQAVSQISILYSRLSNHVSCVRDLFVSMLT